MRYTRYEYKKLNKIKFLCIIVISVGISIVGGTYISNLVFDGEGFQGNSNDSSNHLIDENKKSEVQNIIVLQCGYYSKEENAKELSTRISKYCQPFIVEEEGKYRVLAGIYKENDGLKKIDEFKTNNIEVSKVRLSISNDNIEQKKISEVVDGILIIINKLDDNGVKGVKTTEFKEWADKIINDEINIESKKIQELSSYIKNLPDEINKENSNNIMRELYKFIKN